MRIKKRTFFCFECTAYMQYFCMYFPRTYLLCVSLHNFDISVDVMICFCFRTIILISNFFYNTRYNLVRLDGAFQRALGLQAGGDLVKVFMLDYFLSKYVNLCCWLGCGLKYKIVRYHWEGNFILFHRAQSSTYILCSKIVCLWRCISDPKCVVYSTLVIKGLKMMKVL